MDQPHVNILSLPVEICQQILQIFSNEIEGVEYEIIYQDDDFLEILQNARLVCRYFNQIASPLLLPALRVHLNQASLDRAIRLTRNPQIAAGVLRVQVILSYRPREIAHDLRQYAATTRRRLGHQWSDRCDYLLEGTNDLEEVARLESAATAFAYLNEACADAARDDGVVIPADELDASSAFAAALLRRAYDEYREKHEEQYRLLTEGTFVAGVAAVCARAPSMASLHYLDHDGRNFDPFDVEGLTSLAHDSAKMHETLVEALGWKAIEDCEPKPTLRPVTLLWELPIALRRAGRHLRYVAICAFPLTSGFEMLSPEHGGATWDDLRDALRDLETFVFGSGGGNMNTQRIRRDHLEPRQKAFVDEYLGSFCCGAKLRSLLLSFYSFGVNTGQNPTLSGQQLFNVGSILNSLVGAARLRRLRLRDASAEQDELERVLTGLAADGLEVVDLYNVALRGSTSSWRGIVDILRDNVLTSGATVELEWLLGGEFDIVAAENGSTDVDGEQLCRQMLDYVSASTNGPNPLAGICL